MTDDPLTDDVLEGVRAAREAFARAHGYDVYAIGAALRQLVADGNWPVASRTPVAPDPGLADGPAVPPGRSPEPGHVR